MRVQLKIDQRALERLERADLLGAIKRGAAIGMTETAAHVQRSKVSGQLLGVRTGALRRSIRGDAVSRSHKVVAYVGASTPYARIHEEGGTIRPKAAQYLTIPTRHAMTPAGVIRGGARSFPNTFVRKTRSGNPAIFQRRGKQVVPLFWLVKSVKVKAKRYLRTGLEDKLDTVYRRITREIMGLFS